MNNHDIFKKSVVCFICIMIFTLVTGVKISAASMVSVVESNINNNSAELFIAGDDELKEPVAKISAGIVEIQEFGKFSETNGIVDTLFLVDVSTSINKADQKQIVALFEDLLKSKRDNSHYALMSFGESVNLLCDFTDDRYEFEQAVKSMQFNEQGSSFYSAVRNAIETVQEQKIIGKFVQVVVITDGIEYDDSGITQNEMFAYIKQSQIPIHTFGCVHKNNTEQLKSLHAISRIGSGISTTLNDTVSELSKSLKDFEDKLYHIQFEIPESLKDGSIRTVGIYLNNHSEADVFYDLRMPMTTKTSEQSQIETEESETVNTEITEAVTEQEHYPQTNLLLIGTVAIVTIIIAIIVILICSISKRKQKISKNNNMEIPMPVLDIDDTNNDERTEFCSSHSDGGTQILVKNVGTVNTVTLICVNNQYNRFEVATDSPVIVGRNSNYCNIVIDTDKSVSGKHCKIYGRDSEVYIEDLNSTNHTYVNGEQIHSAVRVHSGDILKFGRVQYEIRFDE